MLRVSVDFFSHGSCFGINVCNYLLTFFYEFKIIYQHPIH